MTNFVNAQNTWSSLDSNDFVNWLALKDAVYTGAFSWGGTSFPTTNTDQFLYKNLATLTNYAAVTLNSSRAATNFLIKSDFTNANSNTIYLFGGTVSGGCTNSGLTSSTAACSNGATSCIITSTYSGTLATSTRVTANSTISSSTNYYPYGTTTSSVSGWAQVGQDTNGYYIAGLGTCSTPVYSYYLTSSGYSSSSTVCSYTGTLFTVVYSQQSALIAGTTYLYSDTECTTPIVGIGAKFYGIQTTAPTGSSTPTYYIQINTAGLITVISHC